MKPQCHNHNDLSHAPLRFFNVRRVQPSDCAVQHEEAAGLLSPKISLSSVSERSDAP